MKIFKGHVLQVRPRTYPEDTKVGHRFSEHDFQLECACEIWCYTPCISGNIYETASIGMQRTWSLLSSCCCETRDSEGSTALTNLWQSLESHYQRSIRDYTPLISMLFLDIDIRVRLGTTDSGLGLHPDLSCPVDDTFFSRHIQGAPRNGSPRMSIAAKFFGWPAPKTVKYM